MKPSIVAVALLATFSLVIACSGGDTGKTGDGTSEGSSGTQSSSGSTKNPKNPSSSSTSSGSSSQTCQSSSLNGQCTAGPKKGTSCCYAPSSPDDPACSSAHDCENVCKYCS